MGDAARRVSKHRGAVFYVVALRAVLREDEARSVSKGYKSGLPPG